MALISLLHEGDVLQEGLYFSLQNWCQLDALKINVSKTTDNI